MKNVLSIQSHVAYGHAGNSAAVFPLQRAGVNVFPVHTVTFSNHTGYGSWRGPLIPASEVAAVVQGIDERGALERCDALLCGYQGSPEVGQVILDAARLTKERNPRAVFCADPVMGDIDRGFYAAPGIPEFMRDHVVPAADIMTPNLFELQFLTGRTLTTTQEVLEAARELRDRGPQVVLVTSARTNAGTLEMMAVGDQGEFVVDTPVLERTFTGSGDLTAATFVTHWLATGDLRATLGTTASVVFSVLEQTAASDESELQLVAAQEHIVNPGHRFEARLVD